MQTAQKRFSKGMKGSVMPRSREESLKYTKKMTTPKYTRAWGAEMRSDFLSTTKIRAARRLALVELQIEGYRNMI